MSSLFGPTNTSLYPSAGRWLTRTPPTAFAETSDPIVQSDEDDEQDDLVIWCREAAAILKREKQEVTEAQITSMNLYKGGMPWWKGRASWKISKKFNYCFYVPQKWTQVLCDSQSKVTYTAFSQKNQRIADIATAAYQQSAKDGEWERVKRSAVLNSRIQAKSFLRLTPEMHGPGGKFQAKLSVATGEQLYVNKDAATIDDAEVIMYEYPLSANKVYARWPHLREKIQVKRERDGNRTQDKANVTSPSTSMTLPTGNTVTNPPYVAGANPPSNSGNSGGMIIREFWTFPRKTIKIKSVQFNVAGEPATRVRHMHYTDGTTSPMRRVVTEGGILYEWPQDFLDIVIGLHSHGGLTILDDTEAHEVIKKDKEYLLYPDGRLTIIVDEEFRGEDRMNPLGYTPFIEIEAYPDTTFWGVSDNDIIADAYEYFVRLLCSLLDAANLTSNPIWRLPLSSEISDDDITNAPGAIQREDLISLKYGKREPGPEMPQYVIPLLAKVEELIMKLSNLNEIATGQAKFKGQQSAETVSMYQDTAAVSFRDALASIQRADVKLGKQYLQLMARFATTPQLITVKNSAGVDEEIPFLGTHLIAPLKVEAKPGTSMPNSPAARMNMALNMVQSGQPLVDLPELWSLMEQVGYIDSASALERRIEKEMGDPKQAWKVPGRPGANVNTKPKAKKANGRRANKK